MISKPIVFLGSGISFSKSYKIIYEYEEITLSFKANKLD